MAFDLLSVEFRDACDRVRPKLRACAHCDSQAERFFKPEDHPALGAVVHAVCPNCAAAITYVVDLLLRDPMGGTGR